MFKIRPSRDHVLLAQLNEPVQHLHHQMYPSIFKPFDREGIEAFMEGIFRQKNTGAWVAWQNEDAVGYIVYRILEQAETAYKYADRVIYIDQIFVDPGKQQSGIGRALVEEVIKLGTNLQVSAVQLDHWTANDGARAFFAKNGFHYFQEKMQLTLSS